MHFKFDELRALQATVTLLRLEGRLIPHPKLIGLLYLADRLSLQDIGTPITGASPHCTINGITLKEVFDRLSLPKSYPIWTHCVNHFTQIIAYPGDSELSDYDETSLKTLHCRFKDYTPEGMTNLTRKLPEWKEPKPQESLPLDPVEILKAANVDESVIQTYESANLYLNRVQELLVSPTRRTMTL